MKGIAIAVGVLAVGLTAVVVLRRDRVEEPVGASTPDPPVELADAEGARPSPDEPAPPGPDPEPSVPEARQPLDDDPAPAAPPSAPLRVQVVDEITGEPAPQLRLDLLRGERREELRTDAEGRLVSAEAYTAGTLVLELVADRHPNDLIQGSGREAFRAFEWTRALEHDPAAGERRLELPVGPSYRLRILGPAGLSIDGMAASLRAADGRFAHDHIYGTVRRDPGGGPPGVRFSPIARLLSGGPPYRLAISTPDGLLYGDVLVEPVVGRHPEVLDVQLEARGAVTGQVLAADGSPAAKRWVQLWCEGASFNASDPDLRPRILFSDEEGRYHHRNLAAGSYELKVDLKGHKNYLARVEVRLGETLGHDVQLEALPPEATDGVVRGRVLSASGTYDAALEVIVQQRGGGTRRTMTVDWRQEGEARVGHFEATGLLHVPHIVSFRQPGFLVITPNLEQVTPDALDREYLVEDRVQVAPVTVRAVDAETGAAIDAFDVTLTVEPGPGERYKGAEATGGEALFEQVPRELPWALRVTADGYAAAWLESHEVEGSTAEVPLRRGWSGRIAVVDPDDRPLAGVLVQLDDEPVGHTDAEGRLIVHLEDEPQTARFEYRDWNAVATSTYNPETGRFRSFIWWLEVTLAPPE